jgi:hypothetical protein
MRAAFAVVAGAAAGILLSGIVSASLMMALPERLRGAELLWTISAVTTAVMIWAFWSCVRPKRE